MLISQTVSPLSTPSLREALTYGGARADWERAFDEGGRYRHDDFVLGLLEQQARAEELRRVQERKRIWAMPAPVCLPIAQPHLFRGLFRRDFGGVSGRSDWYFDGTRVTVDGVSGKVRSFIDAMDSTHLLQQLTTSKQVALAAAHASFANALVTTWVAASVNGYESNRPAAAWSHWSQDTGMHAHLTCRMTDISTYRFLFGVGLANNDPGNANAWGALFEGNSNIGWAVAKTGGVLNMSGVQVGKGVLNTPTQIQLEHGSGHAIAPFYGKTTGFSVQTNGYINLPLEANTPTTSLRLGAQSAVAFVGQPFVGQIHSFFGFYRWLSDADRVIANGTIQGITGIAP